LETEFEEVGKRTTVDRNFGVMNAGPEKIIDRRNAAPERICIGRLHLYKKAIKLIELKALSDGVF